MTDTKIDQRLLIAIRQGNRTALAELYDRHASQMLAVAARILQNPRDAEALLHDVFLEAWQKAESYDAGRGTVRTWLLTRMRSRAIDRLRTVAVARAHGMALVSPGLPVAMADPTFRSTGHESLVLAVVLHDGLEIMTD